MSVRRAVYSMLLHLLLPLVLLRLLWRSRRQPAYLDHLGERFGFYAAARAAPIIWLHAVSVGETRAAEPLIEQLGERWPDHHILLTHMTPTGREAGEHAFGNRVSRCYLPYDLPWATARFVSHFGPRLGILLETELWPNLIHACCVQSVPLFLVNARLSERSARGYARLAGFSRETLLELAGIGAQTAADARRFCALGAERVTVCGNLKFDRSPRPLDLELGRRFRSWFGTRPVFLAASTREGEEEKVLSAVQQAAHPELLTVIVPRHPQRFDEVARLLEQRGLVYQRRSSYQPLAPDTALVLGDSMGEMYAYYAACDLAFVGGSLLPLGGQNLLEACALGKPTLVGPYTFNFAEATRLAIDAGAALQVGDERELGGAIALLLEHPEQREQMGAAALAFMRQHQGATQRTLALLQMDSRR